MLFCIFSSWDRGLEGVNIKCLLDDLRAERLRPPLPDNKTDLMSLSMSSYKRHFPPQSHSIDVQS